MNRSRTAGIFIRRSGQSLDEEDVVDDVDVEVDEDEPEDDASPLDVLSEAEVGELFSRLSSEVFFSPLSSAVFFAPPEADRRSFLAQPEPLKTIVGGANALRIGPEPHSGHASGAGSFTPWMTSKRRPQAAQM
jgi:hypothetical protein